MSGGISLTTVATVVTAAAAVGSAAYTISQGSPKAPSVNVAPPPVPPQEAQAPNAQGTLATVQAGGAAPGGGGGPGGGVASTLLTGGKGIDPKDLSLGKNTLLGG